MRAVRAHKELVDVSPARGPLDVAIAFATESPGDPLVDHEFAPKGWKKVTNPVNKERQFALLKGLASTM